MAKNMIKEANFSRFFSEASQMMLKSCEIQKKIDDVISNPKV